MSSTTRYHHGDLPSALVSAAMELLEDEGATELSLRAVARRAGVSTAAPYRHFADRTALLSAVAAVGYRELAGDLAAVHHEPVKADDLGNIAVAYVRFALKRPGLFRVMFAEQCDSGSAERVAAVEDIQAYLNSIVQQAFPTADQAAMATAVWGMVHGLAFLHLDGKLDTSSDEVVAERVSSAVRAVLAASDHVAGSR